MKRLLTIAAITFGILCSSVYALYTVANEGLWPKTWPEELEPLRKHSRTLVGPKQEYQHYAIPFATREEFETAWPHLLKVKTQGAPIVLRRGPSFWMDDKKQVGVCIHTPTEGQSPETDPLQVKGNWERTIYIELITDGQIVDLNRIALPADTPIVDERFKDQVSSQVKP